MEGGLEKTIKAGQSFSEMEEHAKKDHKEAFDDGVIGSDRGFIEWNNWSN